MSGSAAFSRIVTSERGLLMDYWPFCPKNITEIFEESHQHVPGYLISAISYALDLPVIMVEFDRENKINELFSSAKLPAFCTYLKDSIPGGKKLCDADTEEKALRHMQASSRAARTEEIKCHMGLRNFIGAVKVCDQPVAVYRICNFCKDEDKSEIRQRTKALKGRLRISDTQIEDLIQEIEEIPIRTSEEISIDNRNLEKEASCLGGIIESYFLAKKRGKEEDFFKKQRMLLTKSPIPENRERLWERVEDVLQNIMDFCGVQYVGFFEGSERDYYVLELKAQKGLPGDIQARMHFNWKKANLFLDNYETSEFSLNGKHLTQLKRGLKGGGKFANHVSLIFPFQYAIGHRGAIILGPFRDSRVDVEIESEFLFRMCHIIGLRILMLSALLDTKEKDRILRLNLTTAAHAIRSGMHKVLGLASSIKDREIIRLSDEEYRLTVENLLTQIDISNRQSETLMKNPFAVVGPIDELECAFSQQSLIPLILNSVDRHQPAASLKNVDIRVDASIERLPATEIDRTLFEQAFSYILDNAVKYSHERRWIDISAHWDRKGIHLCVEDFGLGVADDEKEKIFEWGYRSKYKERELFPLGAGLGLPQAKAVIEAHGGKIGVACHSGLRTVKSKEGEGYLVTFTITTPYRVERRSE